LEDDAQESRRLLEQIMNEIRNSNVLMQVQFLRPATVPVQDEDVPSIEAVLQMEEQKEFVLQDLALYDLADGVHAVEHQEAGGRLAGVPVGEMCLCP